MTCPFCFVLHATTGMTCSPRTCSSLPGAINDFLFVSVVVPSTTARSIGSVRHGGRRRDRAHVVERRQESDEDIQHRVCRSFPLFVSEHDRPTSLQTLDWISKERFGLPVHRAPHEHSSSGPREGTQHSPRGHRMSAVSLASTNV